MQILTLRHRGLHPPRLHEPPLSDDIWELIQSCWVREASKRPGIEEVTKRMSTLFQSMPPTLALTFEMPPRDPSGPVTSSTISPVRRFLPCTIFSRFTVYQFSVPVTEQVPRISSLPQDGLMGPPSFYSDPPLTNFPCPCLNEAGQPYMRPTPYPGNLWYQPSPQSMYFPHTIAKRLIYLSATQQKPSGMEDVMEMASMYSTPAFSHPDSVACNSPYINTPYFSASSSPSTSAFKTPASSFSPHSPISRRGSQSARQSGLAITARYVPYETPPKAPWSVTTSSTAPPSNERDLSAALKAKLEHFSSTNFGNLEATQQSDVNTDVFTMWQNVTLDPGFKVRQCFT